MRRNAIAAPYRLEQSCAGRMRQLSFRKTRPADRAKRASDTIGFAGCGVHGPVRLVAREEVELVVAVAARLLQAGEEPVPTVVVHVQCGVQRADAGDQLGDELPMVGECGGAVELDVPARSGLGNHVPVASVVEHERVRQVVGALQDRSRLGHRAVVTEFDHRDVPLVGGEREFLDEEVLA